MNRLLKTLFATALLVGAVSAHAVPVTFGLTGAPGSSVDIVDFNGGLLCGLTGCGVEASLNPLLGSLSQELSAGDSWTFEFFDLNFHGLGGGTGTIQASLGLSSPSGAPLAGGSGSGGFGTFFGLISGGHLTWDTQPGSFTLLDGTSYSVAFENLDSLTVGSATVHATITLLQEAGSV